jgi:hypothetical protein
VSACNPVVLNPFVSSRFDFLLDPVPEEWGLDRVLVDRAEIAAKRLQLTAQIPSPNYFRMRGHHDPLGRASDVEISQGAGDCLKPFSGVVIEPPQKLYDDNLHNIALKPFLDAYDAETDFARQSAIFHAIFPKCGAWPSNLESDVLERGIQHTLQGIERDFDGQPRRMFVPFLKAVAASDYDATGEPREKGRLPRKIRQEGSCPVSWEEDESNHGARFTYAAWTHTVGYRPKRATEKTFISDASEKIAYLFKGVLVDSAEIWSPRKKKKSKGIDSPKTLYLENGEWVYACTRNEVLSGSLLYQTSYIVLASFDAATAHSHYCSQADQLRTKPIFLLPV